MKRWKWILGIAALLVFSATVVAVVILSSIDFNTLKPFLRQTLQEETGRDLEIRGAIDLKLGFRPSLVAREVLFQNAPWASRPEMVTIKRLEAKIMVLPLFKKEIRVTRLVLLEPDVLLETNKTGKWNFEFDKSQVSPKGDGSPHGLTLPRMSFQEVEIEKGRVCYRDGATGRLHCVAIDRFTVHSEGIESPVVLAFNGSYQGKPLELSGTVGSLLVLKGEDNAYKLSDLRMSSIAGEAGGNLTVRLGGSRPKFSGVVTAQRLDLKPLFNGKNKTQAKPETAAKTSRLFPNGPLPLDLLKSVDLELELNAGHVQWTQFPLTNLKMVIRVNEGRLVLSPITAEVAGGDASGRFEMHAQGSGATAKAVLKASQMDLQTLSAGLNIEGKLDVDLELLSRGSSIAGLLAGLNGRTVAVMGQGRVDNKNIQLLGGDLASGVYKVLNSSSKDANFTDIHCGVSGFDITNGMATVTALVVDTPDMTLIGEGLVNLRDETLDLALKPYPKGGAGGLNFSLAELAKSFKLVGTLSAPSLQMDAEQTMLAAMKAAGGVLLFGPAGILAALAGESRDGENPCLAALESAKKGVRSSGSERGEEQKRTEEKGIAGTLKGVGESVKKLFGGVGTPPRPDTRPDPWQGGP